MIKQLISSMGFSIILLVITTAFCISALGADEPFLDMYGRDTPKGTVEGYLDAIDQGDFALATEYMDLRYLPRELGEYSPDQLALGLSIVLQRAANIETAFYSIQNSGYLDDGLPDYRDLLANVSLRGEGYDLYLQRVPTENGFIWKVSNATIADLLLLYDEYRFDVYTEWLFHTLPDIRILGIELFKLVSVFTISLLAIPFILAGCWIVSRIISHPDRVMYVHIRKFMMGPLTGFIVVNILVNLLKEMGGRNVMQITKSETLLLLTGLWMIFGLVEVGRHAYAGYLQKHDRTGSLPLLQPLSSAVKAVFATVIVLVWLDNMGYSITALLTGLGVGGLAVALVLQKPLEDVFGAFTLYAQQPIRIGDFGKYGEIIGTIEEISLRTTRIRTLANTRVSVPNLKMASEPIENYSARRKILYNPVILFSNKTGFEVMEKMLEEIKTALHEDEKVLEEGARVNFTAITQEGYELIVFAYINTVDYPEYLKAAEKLNFDILKIIEKREAILFSWGKEIIPNQLEAKV